MQLKIMINGVDFAPYVKENGISLSDAIRCGRTVIAMDGTMHRSQIVKRGMSVNLVTIRDSTMEKLMEAMADRLSVEYTDRDGKAKNGVFYVSDVSAAAKTVRGGNTYWSGVSFTLEPR